MAWTWAVGTAGAGGAGPVPMATTEQMHWVIAPGVQIEQTRRRLARLREEGVVDRVTLPQAGRRRVWLPTGYGVRLAGEWPGPIWNAVPMIQRPPPMGAAATGRTLPKSGLRS